MREKKPAIPRNLFSGDAVRAADDARAQATFERAHRIGDRLNPRRKWLHKLAKLKIEQLYEFVDDETIQRLKQAGEIAAKHPEITILMGANHTMSSDLVQLCYAYFKYVHNYPPKGKHERRVYYPYSHYYTSQLTVTPQDAHTAKGYRRIAAFGEFMGVFGPRMIQPYQITDDRYPYSQANAAEMKKNLIALVAGDEAPVTLLLFPEGTRNQDDARVLAAEPSPLLTKIGREISATGRPVMFIPLGIDCPTGSRDSMNFHHEMRLTAGPLLFNDPNNILAGDLPEDAILPANGPLGFITNVQFMQALASALPENMRGRWGNTV